MTVEEAGVVVARAAAEGEGEGEGDGPFVLLVTAKNNAGEWLFPKGHIEPGESPDDAAVREAREEAGVSALIRCPLDTLRFRFQGDDIRVRYFLAEFVAFVGEGDGRGKRWCSVADALVTLTFPDARRLLAAASPAIERAFGPRRGRP